MIIKGYNNLRTTLNQFDLLGGDETALSKAFSYIIGYDFECFKKFLRYIGIATKIDTAIFQQTLITIEKKRDEGRTDIEIICLPFYHIIRKFHQ
jgi:hypothetical protein